MDDVILRTFVETTDFAFETFMGRIDPGAVAARRFEVIGIVDGKERIILEHISRIHNDVAPHWKHWAEGKPDIAC